MNVLKDLLRIKKFREDKAELDLARARQNLAEADSKLKIARKELRDFEIACERKERELFDDLCQRLVLLKDLDAVALEVELMKEQKQAYESRISEAQELRHAASEAVEQAKLIHREAVRMREKFSELLEAFNATLFVEVQRLEDLEMEEVSASRHEQNRKNAMAERA